MSTPLKMLVAASLLMTACRGGPGASTDADAMSAEAHRRESAEHHREHLEHRRRYESGTRRGYDDSDRYPQELEGYNPTAVYLRLARQHEVHAREHLAAARSLEAFEDAACTPFTPEIRSVCPLLGQVETVIEIPGGVRVLLSPTVDADAAVAHMRCHLAFGRARGRAGMNECPLYVPAVHVEWAGDSQAVDLRSTDPSRIDELRHRSRSHLLPRPLE